MVVVAPKDNAHRMKGHILTTSVRAFLSLFLLLSIFYVGNSSEGEKQHLRTPAQSRIRILQEVGNITIASWIPLFLRLQYLDVSLASKLESGDSSDEAIGTLCSEVNKQAGGNQVKLAAAEVGVIVSTDPASTDCSILATSRVYDDNSPPGFFTMELELVQKVLSSTRNVTLLTSLVEVGFKRGRGGRAQFLENLQGTAYFSNLYEVGIVEKRSLSPPNLPPSFSPSLIPSTSPSTIPTSVPTSDPTSAPTSLPTSLPPSLPTLVPTAIPTTIPSVINGSDGPTFVSSSSHPTMLAETYVPTPYPTKGNLPTLLPSTLQPTAVLSTFAPSFTKSTLPSFRKYPTNAPSLISLPMPTTEPTPPPSFRESLSPSSHLSISPTKLPPNVNPSVEPLNPTLTPSMMPSPVPTFRLPVQLNTIRPSLLIGAPSEPSQDTKEPSIKPLPTNPNGSLGSANKIDDPLVIGGIVGGSIAATVCFCFLVACCWQRHKKRDHNRDDFKVRNMELTNEASSGSTPILPVVPGVVQLNDDNQSLANTTLGEQTAGRVPPKKKKIIQVDSFDESSLYTSVNSIMPSKEIVDDKKPPGGASPKKLGKDAKSGYNTETSAESSFFPSDSDTPSRLTEPSIPDFEMDDRTENLFAGKEEGLLGAVDQFRPLADKIEHMVAAELEETSASSSPSANSTLLGIRQPDSPFGLSRRELGGSNVVIVRDSDDSGILKRTKDENAVESGAHSEIASTDSRSSKTSRIGNTTSFASFSPSSMGSKSSSKSQKQQDAPETFSERGYSSTFPSSPSALLQSKPSDSRVTSSKINMSPVYRSRGLGITKSRSFSYTQHFVPRKSPTNSATSESSYFPPKDSKEKEFDILPGKLSTPPKSSTPKAESEGFITPTNASPPEIYSDIVGNSNGVDKEMIESPWAENRVGAFPTFKSPASMKTTKEQQKTPVTPVSPAPSSSDSEEDNNKFLFGAIEETLGPRSQSADLESLGGRSSRSCGSRVRKKPGNSEIDSIGSRCSRYSGRLSHITLASEDKSDMSRLTPRAIEHDLHRIEKQLAELKTEVTKKKKVARKETPTSPLTMSTGDAASYIPQRNARVSSKQRVIVIVPPGKLGVILANRKDGTGTLVAEVKASSPLAGSLNLGDKLVEIDGVDVTRMVVSDITAMMKATIDKERHLTVITSSKVRSGALSPGKRLKELSGTKHP